MQIILDLTNLRKKTQTITSSGKVIAYLLCLSHIYQSKKKEHIQNRLVL